MIGFGTIQIRPFRFVILFGKQLLVKAIQVSVKVKNYLEKFPRNIKEAYTWKNRRRSWNKVGMFSQTEVDLSQYPECSAFGSSRKTPAQNAGCFLAATVGYLKAPTKQKVSELKKFSKYLDRIGQYAGDESNEVRTVSSRPSSTICPKTN